MILDENLNDISNRLLEARAKIIKKYKKKSSFYQIVCIVLVILLCISFFTNIGYHKAFDDYFYDGLEENLISPVTKEDTLNAMVVAFAVQESNTTELAKSECGQYQGCLQIAPIMVDEANRILGYNNFTYDDRLIWDSSSRIFHIVQNYHNPELDIDKAITIWNKGCPNSYRNNVKKVYKGILRHISTNK